MPQFHHWSDFANHWRQLQSQASRGLLVIEECAATYQQVLPRLLSNSELAGIGVNMVDNDLPAVNNIKPQQASQYLGRSHNLVIYRACDEFNVNSFSALCGTLIGASLAVLIVPAGQHWQDHIDAQGADYGYEPDTVKSPFKSWWQALWQNHKGVMQLSQQAQQDVAVSSVDITPLPSIKPPQCLSSISLLPDQQQMVSKLVGLALVAQKKEKGPANKQLIWVSGARGRGKTVAVAKVLKQLAAQGIKALITSAASQTARAVLHQHDDQTRYIAVDQLLQQATLEESKLSNSVLVVEEAASMPQALLWALMQRFTCLVLVSSSDGYEGTGQGLSLKLLQLAQRNEFQLISMELTQPIRWQEGDLLEELLQQSFLAPKLPVLAVHAGIDNLNHQIVSGDDLALDEPLLSQVYGLLSLAHYQTTPQDLRLLLDHPDLTTHCWLDQQGNLIGVACLMAEGSLPLDLSLAIARGQRRLKGHLLAQILAQQAGCAEAAQLSMQRIQRIAVHPSVQGKGVGRSMLQHIQGYFQACADIQWLGSSFAAEPAVIRFWLSAGYQVVWAGQRLDAATGLPSVQVVLPLQSQGLRLCKLLQTHLFHYYGHLNWDSPLTESILPLLEPAYRGLPRQLLPHIFDQVANYHGNVYGVQAYLYRALLHKDLLSDDDEQWLQHIWQPHLSHKQFSQLTRQLVAQQLPIDSRFLTAVLSSK